MVYEVHIAEQAEGDLDAIFDYCVGYFSNKTIEQIMKGLAETILILEVFSEGLVNFDERIGQQLFVEGSVRMFPFKSYLIFFLIREMRVAVLRVISARTDYLNQLDSLFNTQ